MQQQQQQQDEDLLWRRAFADSSGLFDNLACGPLLNLNLGAADDNNSCLPLPATTPHDPIPLLVGEGNGAKLALPSPAVPVLDFPTIVPTTPATQHTLLPYQPAAAPPPPPLPLLPHQLPPLRGQSRLLTDNPEWVKADGVVNPPSAAQTGASTSSAAAAAAAAIFAVAEPDDYQASCHANFDTGSAYRCLVFGTLVSLYNRRVLRYCILSAAVFPPNLFCKLLCCCAL